MRYYFRSAKESFKIHWFPLLILLVFSIYGLRPLFQEGLYTAHDIWHQVARLYHYGNAVKDGQIPPRWISQLAVNQGYPLFIFSYHFPWIIGTPIMLLGLSVQSTIKVLFCIFYIFSAVSMYALIFILTKDRISSTVGATVYIWVPYQFLTMYVSAAIGTSALFAIVPVLLIGIWYISKNNHGTGILLVAFSASFALLSHLITTVLLFPFLLFMALMLIVYNKKKLQPVVLSFLTAGLLAVSLTSFYILPFIELLPKIKATEANAGFSGSYERYFADLRQLVYSPWGFGPITSNAKDGEISLQIGVSQWLGVGLLTILILVKLIQKRKYDSEILFDTTLVILFAVSVIGMTDFSESVWDLFAKFISFDFPFRLLIISAFFGSLIIGRFLAHLPQKGKLLFGILFIGLAMYSNRNHIRVNQSTMIPLELYVASEITTNTYHEYLPLTANSALVSLNVEQESLTGSESLQLLKQTTSGSVYKVSLSEPTEITLNQFDFPGQTVTIDGKKITHSIDSDGKMKLVVPEGDHILEQMYTGTPLMDIGVYISVFSMFIIVLFLTVTWQEGINEGKIE